MPRQFWTYTCPACQFDHVKVYSTRQGRSAYVVCGRCRALVVFDQLPMLHEPIDLYNLFCDIIRSKVRAKSSANFPPAKKDTRAPQHIILPNLERDKTSRKIVFEAPLCDQHVFVVGEPIRGFQAEMVAQTRICLKCGHTERDQV